MKEITPSINKPGIVPDHTENKPAIAQHPYQPQQAGEKGEKPLREKE